MSEMQSLERQAGVAMKHVVQGLYWIQANEWTNPRFNHLHSPEPQRGGAVIPAPKWWAEPGECGEAHRTLMSLGWAESIDVKNSYQRMTSLDEYTGRENPYFKEDISFNEAQKLVRGT